MARFNEIVTRPLLEGALTTFKAYSVADEDVDVRTLLFFLFHYLVLWLCGIINPIPGWVGLGQVVWVPGSFEIGVVATTLANSGRYDAVLCIGAVVGLD